MHAGQRQLTRDYPVSEILRPRLGNNAGPFPGDRAEPRLG
jgi:hypothetical protein